MTDAHCHVSAGDESIRELLIGRDFFGIHPWEVMTEGFDAVERLREVFDAVNREHAIGVGEIGLDRLRQREISPVVREVFEQQLQFAAEHHLPVVLHGAKCWGQVVAAVRPFADKIPAFLFHGFSRSDGLLPDIVALNGFISVGPAALNDHAVNYCELIKKIPIERILVETDRDETGIAEGYNIREVLAKVAQILSIDVTKLEYQIEQNVNEMLKW